MLLPLYEGKVERRFPDLLDDVFVWDASWCVALLKDCGFWSCSGRWRSSNLLPFVTGHQHHHSLHDLPYHFNQISDTNWDIMTMTKGVKCYVCRMLTGLPSLAFPPSYFLILFFFSLLFWGPKPAKHISKWQLLLLTSKKLGVVDFARPNVASLRTEEERWGPRGQWWFVWGMAGKGSRIRMWRTLAVSRLIQDHWFLLLFFLPPGHDLHCKCKFCRIGLFLESEKSGGWKGVRRSGVPTSHSSSCSPSPCPRIPPQLPLPESPRTTPHHNRLIVGWRGGLDNPAALS